MITRDKRITVHPIMFITLTCSCSNRTPAIMEVIGSKRQNKDAVEGPSSRIPSCKSTTPKNEDTMLNKIRMK